MGAVTTQMQRVFDLWGREDLNPKSDWVVISELRDERERRVSCHLFYLDHAEYNGFIAPLYCSKGLWDADSGFRRLGKQRSTRLDFVHGGLGGRFILYQPQRTSHIGFEKIILVEFLEVDCLVFSTRLCASYLRSDGFKHEVYQKDRAELEEWVQSQLK